jgi:hypothetical protein
MLIFSYSGKEPDMDGGMAEELLKAADKYELTRLKVWKFLNVIFIKIFKSDFLIQFFKSIFFNFLYFQLFCERKLINSLGSSNACAFLSLANLYPAENLKTHSINFIKTHMKEVE